MTIPAMEEFPGNMGRPPELEAAVAEARTLAREQVLAAWQIHVDRVREQLESGWRETIDSIFDERFAEVEGRLSDAFQSAVSARAIAVAEENATYVRSAARRDLTDWLNQTSRRLKQAENRDVWIHSLLDAAGAFCGKAVFFLITGRGLKLEGVRGPDIPHAGEATEIPISSAPAFAGAIESKDTLIVMGTPRELSQAVVNLVGDASGRRVYLFPVVLRQSAVAVLYAEPDGDYVDVSALELLVSLAASSIEMTETVTVRPPAADLVNIGGVEPPKQAPRMFADLPKPEQELHLRAQRFARTQVAQLLLHKVIQVRNGRASNNLYSGLQNEIDAGRHAFRQQYLDTCPSMVDYYHLELVRTLARDSDEALGPDYPGPMVARG
jgi:hypothetical protein